MQHRSNPILALILTKTLLSWSVENIIKKVLQSYEFRKLSHSGYPIENELPLEIMAKKCQMGLFKAETWEADE